ncbi:amidase signature domain-containing protein, partial [Durotheca rogersii]|uniref:amidase signature domain-containing protein n=1 Tax=Durotheca rogersii TaxID=419775 RepID=UPI00221EC1C0
MLPRKTICQAKMERDITEEFINGLLSPEEKYVTNLELPTMMEMTLSGKLRAAKLVRAFCKRAAYGHQLNHNLLEINFEPAIERAEWMDDYYEKWKHPIGPLHGLPITMKDQYHVKGMGTTMGYVGWIDTFEGVSPPKPDIQSVIVRELEALGAIIIAKTTLAQTLGATETRNNILGYNLNPRNQRLSSGGSSGGEGAVQALRGSAIGIGSDVGGSVSIPAAFNGVYSIKPSSGRLSFMGAANSSPGQIIIPTVPGVLGHSVASLEYLVKSLVSLKPWPHYPDVKLFPWRDQGEMNFKLSFGIMKFDGVVMPHPPILRALGTVEKALCTDGHEFIEWDPPPHSDASYIHRIITTANGGYDFFKQLDLSKEPLIEEMESEFPDSRPIAPLDIKEVEEAVIKMKKYKAEYQEYWLSTARNTSTGRPVDALILPVWPSAATIPGSPGYGGYIGPANVLDHCTLVIPVTRADKFIDIVDEAYEPANETDKSIWESYDPDTYHGAPAAIQVQCQRLEEEKLLGIGKVIVKALSVTGATGQLGKLTLEP